MSDLTFIGTSDAFGAGGRRQSAILLRAPGGAVLLDCGLTTNTGLSQLGIDRGAIDSILITHFHADHFGGIPLFVLAAAYEDERTHPLRIAGPVGIEARVRRLAEAMGHPIADRDLPFAIHFEELTVADEREIGPVVAKTFATHHQPAVSPHGFVIRVGSRRVAYSGDTGWFDELPRQVAGCDLFICECTLDAPGFEFHLDHTTLLATREQFDCGRLIITHLGSKMRSRGEWGFEVADDGLEINL